MAGWQALRQLAARGIPWARNLLSKAKPPPAPTTAATTATASTAGKLTRPIGVSAKRWNKMTRAQKQAAVNKAQQTAKPSAPAAPGGPAAGGKPAPKTPAAPPGASGAVNKATTAATAASVAKTIGIGGAAGVGGIAAYDWFKDNPIAKSKWDREKDTVPPYHTQRHLWKLPSWSDPYGRRGVQPPASKSEPPEKDKDLPELEKSTNEAEYQGRDVQLGKPMSSGDGKSKYKVYVRDPRTGNIRKVTFGDPNMEIKRDDPERRKNFRARHGCGTPRASDRTKAAYWSCRMWSSKPISKILKGK